jgi:hypothetical protein
MKKDKTVNSKKKLVLNKQTIRELRPVDLERPAGGTRGGFDDGDTGTGDTFC